ncbi:hypothetical protein ACSBR2_031436 [Camellia fascicularis]
MVSSLGLSSVDVEGDNRKEFCTVIADIRSFASQCNLSFSWCARNANEVAYWIAQACLYGYLPCNWISYPLAALLVVLTR